MNTIQQKFLEERIKELKNDLAALESYIFNGEMHNEMDKIDSRWEVEVNKHKNPLKLIILAEAPLSYKKYFYNQQFTFLDSLRSLWDLALNSDLPDKMLKEGVLLLDIYSFPIPSSFYKKDTRDVLYDDIYLSNKFKFLKNKGLINEKTHLTFRYKELYKKRNLHQTNALKGLNILKDKTGNPISLNSAEKPQKLNIEIEKLLK